MSRDPHESGGGEGPGAAATRVAAKGILVTHGGMADGLLDAVEGIAGPAADFLHPVSNQGLSRDDLCRQIRQLAGEGPAVVFTDMPMGSCAMAARLTCDETAGRAVISGVNLPMLLEFVFHRREPLDELVARLAEKGRAAIQSSASTDVDGHPPVSG